MNQAALRFDDEPFCSPAAEDARAFDATAFEIGWDHAHYRLVPPLQHLQPGSAVRQGWQAGQEAFGSRTLRPGPHVRKWLQLRLNAWTRGKAFEGVQVTPHLLAQIDVPVCPITREVLTRGTGGPTDASVDRVNNAAGYAAGNLAVMSARANQAKSDHDWREAMDFARQVERGQAGAPDALEARHWARLAVLISFCTPLPHDQAATLPLLLLPPNRLRVLNPVQVLQVVLSQRHLHGAADTRIAQWARLFPAHARTSAYAFMTTLLARRLGAGPCAEPVALRAAMEAAWACPLVLKRWQRLALDLTPGQCERIVAMAVQHRLAGPGLRCLSLEQATEGWALGSGGLAEADGAAGSPHRRPPEGPVPSPRPRRVTKVQAFDALPPAACGRYCGAVSPMET